MAAKKTPKKDYISAKVSGSFSGTVKIDPASIELLKKSSGAKMDNKDLESEVDQATKEVTKKPAAQTPPEAQPVTENEMPVLESKAGQVIEPAQAQPVAPVTPQITIYNVNTQSTPAAPAVIEMPQPELKSEQTKSLESAVSAEKSGEAKPAPTPEELKLYDEIKSYDWKSGLELTRHYDWGSTKWEAKVTQINRRRVVNLDGRFYVSRYSENESKLYFFEVTPSGLKNADSVTQVVLEGILHASREHQKEKKSLTAVLGDDLEVSGKQTDCGYFDGEYAHSPNYSGAYKEGAGSTLVTSLGKPITIDEIGDRDTYRRMLAFYRSHVDLQESPKTDAVKVKIKKGKKSFRGE